MSPVPQRQTPVVRGRLIEAITAPLGFFVLALLIVESFLATVLVGTPMEPANTLIGMWAGVAMFVRVVSLVFVLVWFKPENLTFGKEDHLRLRGIIPGDTPNSERGPTKRKRGGPRVKRSPSIKKPAAKTVQIQGEET